MEIRLLNGALGAELSGLRLETIDDVDFKELHESLLEHQVVFLRAQDLSEDGHRSLAQRFGTPSVFPLGRHFGATETLSHIEDERCTNHRARSDHYPQHRRMRRCTVDG